MERGGEDLGMSMADVSTSDPEEQDTPAQTATPQESSAGQADGTTPTENRSLLARILDRYPELPPAPTGPLARICFAVVCVMAAAFAVYFAAYTFALHDAYKTFGEDLGIMDQALWNTVHGAPLHQTICNSFSDTNCLGDVSRLAIHFEPIMFVISLLYVIVPSPKTLQLLQALVVASGAFPAYWLASRKLRSALAGVAFAAIYLLFPALQAAVTYDFHAVTLSAAFLMFALYFMLARNNVGLVIACVLALSTKEEVPLDVIMIGLSVALLQRRWRLGAGLVALALVWIGVEFPIMHAASPLGMSPTAGRYDYLKHSSIPSILREHVFDRGGIYYLRTLLSPAAYLPLLCPWALAIAAPAIGLNLLSDYPSMRTGMYHYNAEIVPVLVFAAIEAVALLAAIGGWLAHRYGPVLRRVPVLHGVAYALTLLYGLILGAFHGVRLVLETPGNAITGVHATPFDVTHTQGTVERQLATVPFARVVMAALTLLALFFGIYEQSARGALPWANGVSWPEQTAHTRLADTLLPLIPDDASVSAQAALVPHVSHRRFIYQFPYKANEADYVFLDVTGDLYPYSLQPYRYVDEVQKLLDSHTYHVVAAKDGYLLLARGTAPDANPANPYGLPDSFFSFARLPAGGSVPHPVQANFGSSLQLVGYDIAPTSTPSVNTYTTIRTYWRVTAPLSGHYAVQLVLNRPDDSRVVLRDFPATTWLSLDRWQPGETLVVQAPAYFLNSRNLGDIRLGVRVLSGTDEAAQNAFVSPMLISAPGLAGGAPAVNQDGTQVIFAVMQVR